MNKLSGTLFAVLLLAVANAWGGCGSCERYDTYVDVGGSCVRGGCGDFGGKPDCLVPASCNTIQPSDVYNMQVVQGDKYYTHFEMGQRIFKTEYGDELPCDDSRCALFGIIGASVSSSFCCDLCGADSLNCQNAGGTWTNTGASTCGGMSCKENHCKAADTTWLTTSISSCSGENNYAIVNTDSTCEHVGTCCPNDSIPSGNTCKWRCDSVLTTCNNRTGDLFGGVLPDTSVSGQDTTFSYQCYYNCSHSPNADSSVYLVEGNIVLGGPSDSIPDGIKSQSTFNSVRTTTGGVYVYDYLTPAASEYIDSIAAMKCVEHLWRCVINSKYVYWYDNQEVPAGCTNIVRVK